MFKFKKEVERFIFSEEGKIPHQKAILAGLLAFALSIGQARANDTTFKGCRANAGANDITFWLHLSDDGITDETHSIDIPNPFGTDPAKTLGALGLLNVPDSEQYSLLSSTLEQGSVHVSDHISGTHHWYGGSCRNDDHFSSDFTVPLSGDVVYHQNALNIRESDTGLTAEHTHDINSTSFTDIPGHVSDHYNGCDYCCEAECDHDSDDAKGTPTGGLFELEWIDDNGNPKEEC